MEVVRVLKWRKGSKCDSATCVEAAKSGALIAVRDSKDPNGPVLYFSRNEWTAFVASVRVGDFDFTEHEAEAELVQG